MMMMIMMMMIMMMMSKTEAGRFKPKRRLVQLSFLTIVMMSLLMMNMMISRVSFIDH